jgi:hypothetical protein
MLSLAGTRAFNKRPHKDGFCKITGMFTHLEPLRGPLEGVGALAAPRLRRVCPAARPWPGLLIIRVIQSDRLIVLPLQAPSLYTAIQRVLSREVLSIPYKCLQCKAFAETAQSDDFRNSTLGWVTSPRKGRTSRGHVVAGSLERDASRSMNQLVSPVQPCAYGAGVAASASRSSAWPPPDQPPWPEVVQGQMYPPCHRMTWCSGQCPSSVAAGSAGCRHVGSQSRQSQTPAKT